MGLPHTKLSGGTKKMLRPCSASGWAQVAVTEACSVRPSSHGGNQRSWQSHRKLSLLIRLQEKQRNALSTVATRCLVSFCRSLLVPLQPQAIYLEMLIKCSFWLHRLDGPMTRHLKCSG